MVIHGQASRLEPTRAHGWGAVLAVAGVIVTVPMIIIFFLGQRYFVEGIATTGSKG